MVKCSECGFLAVRDIATHELQEAQQTFRDGKEIPKASTGKDFPTDLFHPEAICFAGVCPLHTLCDSWTKPERRLEVITADRDCERFIDWQQGFTPKEHAEMIIQDKQREWQEKRENADRDWRAAQAKLEHEFRVQQAAEAAKRDDDRAKREREWRREDARRHLQSLIAIIVAAFIGGLFTVAAAMYAW